jgi:hypothetical protein
MSLNPPIATSAIFLAKAFVSFKKSMSGMALLRVLTFLSIKPTIVLYRLQRCA